MFIPLPDDDEAFLHYARQLQLILDIRADIATMDMFYDWVISCSQWTSNWTNFMLKDIEKERKKSFEAIKALYIVNTWSPIMDELEKYIQIAKKESNKNKELLYSRETGPPYLYEDFVRELRIDEKEKYKKIDSGILLVLAGTAMSWESKLDKIILTPYKSSGKDKIGNIKQIRDTLDINLEDTIPYYQIFSTIPWVTMYSAAINNFDMPFYVGTGVERHRYACLIGMAFPFLKVLKSIDRTLAAKIERGMLGY